MQTHSYIRPFDSPPWAPEDRGRAQATPLTHERKCDSNDRSDCGVEWRCVALRAEEPHGELAPRKYAHSQLLGMRAAQSLRSPTPGNTVLRLGGFC